MADGGITKGSRWSRLETLAAFNLYSRTPFGRLHSKNPDIVELASWLGRTPSSVAMKCVNLASLDPAVQAAGKSGLRGVSNLDREIWNEFMADPEDVGFESELAYASMAAVEPRMLPPSERAMDAVVTDKLAIKKVRVTQHLFRDMVLSSYDAQCAICTLSVPQLLIASHIVGWSVDAAHRMNPRNGICLCSLHDRAFDTGMLDIDERCIIHITDKCTASRQHRVAKEMLFRFDGEGITMPNRWHPDPALLTARRQHLGIA